MNQRTEVSEEPYKDKAVYFLADRYHLTSRQVIQRFLVQNDLISPTNTDTRRCWLEENEIEILRNLTSGNYSNTGKDIQAKIKRQ